MSSSLSLGPKGRITPRTPCGRKSILGAGKKRVSDTQKLGNASRIHRLT